MSGNTLSGSIPGFMPSLILVVMAFLSLVLSVLFYLKAHTLSRIPRNLSVDIFDRTFSVFDPYPSHRRIIHSFITSLPIVTFLVSFVVGWMIIIITETGLLLSLLVLILCLSLIVIDEASEIYSNANTFVKAIRNGTPMGSGDLTALSFLGNALPELAVYYLLLTILFLASSIALPYIVPMILLGISQFARYVYISSDAGLVVPLLMSFLFFSVVFAIQIAAKKIKSKILKLGEKR